MKTITLSGIIKYEYDTWDKIKLIQEDGYKIDLVSRFQEAIESFGKSEVQVNYWISDKPCTKNEMLEGWLRQLYGAAEAEYQANGYAYSSWTSGTDYDTELSVGGHNLHRELREHGDKFIIIELNFKDLPKRRKA